MSDCGCGTSGLNPTGEGNDKVNVDASDTVADYLSPKFSAGAGVTLTVLNPGANESIEIAALGVGSTPHAETFFPIDNQVLFNLAAVPAVATATALFINGWRYTYGINYTVAAGVLTWLNVDFHMAAGMTVIIAYSS